MTELAYAAATLLPVAFVLLYLLRQLLISRRIKRRNAMALQQMQIDISTALDAERKKKQ